MKVDRLDPGFYKCLLVKCEIQFCSMSQFIYGYEQLFMRNLHDAHNQLVSYFRIFIYPSPFPDLVNCHTEVRF